MPSTTVQVSGPSQPEDPLPSTASSSGDELDQGEKGQGQEHGSNDAEKSEPVVNVVSTEDVPPDGGYGWVIALCVFLANAHTWGINSSWGVLLEHFLNNNTFPGATKFEYAVVGGLSISQALIIAPFVVACQGWFGTRYTMLCGSLLIFMALFTAAASSHIWHLVLSQGLCFGYGMGFVYIPVSCDIAWPNNNTPHSC